MLQTDFPKGFLKQGNQSNQIAYLARKICFHCSNSTFTQQSITQLSYNAGGNSSSRTGCEQKLAVKAWQPLPQHFILHYFYPPQRGKKPIHHNWKKTLQGQGCIIISFYRNQKGKDLAPWIIYHSNIFTPSHIYPSIHHTLLPSSKDRPTRRKG